MIDESISDRCRDGCQHSKDVGMYPEHQCFGQCYYKRQENMERDGVTEDDLISKAAEADAHPNKDGLW